MCNCGKKWHQCTLHYPSVFCALGPPNRRSQDPTAQTLGAQDSAISNHNNGSSATRTQARLNSLEPHRASRLCLGPKLSARFPHLKDAPT
eukprot:11477351-Karenia_brevis.AAC.1